MRRAAGVVLSLAVACGAAAGAGARGETVRVETREALRRALAVARPGTRILVAPGAYEGGLYVESLRGEAEKPIVLAPEDPGNPPVFRGGAVGLHLTDPAHVVLEGLVFEGAEANGVNVDDGGSIETPAHHVVLRDVVVRDLGPRGNRDGVKLSGVEDFRLEGCTVERWGAGGSAVDLVGCRRGTIERCVFRHSPGVAGASGVQAKGASRGISVVGNRFEHAGGRAVNVGGSTGLALFRPPLASWSGDKYEAKDVRIEGNTFVGAQAAAAFVGVDGGVFRWNTVYAPERWAFRILQETREPGFVPTRRVEVSDNVVAFRSDRWSEGGVNVGPGTDPASFRFARNAWFCLDAPERTRELVRLPAREDGGTYGRDPLFRDAGRLDLRLKPESPARGKGAEAAPR